MLMTVQCSREVICFIRSVVIDGRRLGYVGVKQNCVGPIFLVSFVKHCSTKVNVCDA